MSVAVVRRSRWQKMASTLPDDILLPTATGSADRRPCRSHAAAFVPITIAIIGVAAILVGRVTVHEFEASGLVDGVDPVITGSVKAGGVPDGR